MGERLERIVEGAYAFLPVIGSVAVAAKYPAGNFTGKYLIETAFPFGAYFLTELISPYYGASFKNRGRFVAGFLLSLFYGIEIAQAFSGFFGKFDPNDFVAYTAGMCLALAADKLTFGRNP
ncbi:hypothetical protein HYU07_02975 [Candidatus Woesearchaeota archaeon]|nr:hypothetical protein [Candidatus Woesearchaeota archaeon]